LRSSCCHFAAPRRAYKDRDVSARGGVAHAELLWGKAGLAMSAWAVAHAELLWGWAVVRAERTVWKAQAVPTDSNPSPTKPVGWRASFLVHC
jgi:hypothetical protein